MEDIKAASTRLILSSAGLILFLGGWASFADTIPIGNLGLKLTSLHIAPIILIAFWAFSWQRFFVLSREANKSSIDDLILKKINDSEFVYSAFPPKSFGLNNVKWIHKWGWTHAEIPQNVPDNYVFYKRMFAKRLFMFQYHGLDVNNEGLHIHFGPVASNINNGAITPLKLGYWKCIYFEIKTLVPRFFDTPVVGFHYFPHIFAWVAFTYICIWNLSLVI